MKLFSNDIVKEYSKTDGERNEVDETIAKLLFVKSVLGQNILDPNWNWKSKISKQIIITFLLIYVILGTKDYLKDATDLTSIGEAYYTIYITSSFPVKFLLFANSRETFRKLYIMAKTTLLYTVKMDSVKKYKELLKKLKLIVQLLFSIALFPVITYLLVAIYYYVLGIRVTLSKTTSILMPMKTPYHEIGLLLHTIYFFCMSFTYLMIDMWFAVFMYIFCMACDSLVSVLKVDPQQTDETDLAYALLLNDRLRIFYKHHQKLMEYLNILKDMYKWPTVHPIITVLLALCLILFLLSEDLNLTFLCNLVPAFMELFAYCWFGEQLIDKGTDLRMALLDFDWTSLRLKDKKNYLIIISYMTKEYNIQTAFGNELSLCTMSAVIKSSYQACAVLRTMET